MGVLGVFLFYNSKILSFCGYDLLFFFFVFVMVLGWDFDLVGGFHAKIQTLLLFFFFLVSLLGEREMLVADMELLDLLHIFSLVSQPKLLGYSFRNFTYLLAI